MFEKDTSRYTGAVYKASSWIHDGRYQGARLIRTGTSFTISPSRTAGSGPCEEIGIEPSIVSNLQCNRYRSR